jgi:hypothetical protein
MLAHLALAGLEKNKQQQKYTIKNTRESGSGTHSSERRGGGDEGKRKKERNLAPL